MTLVEEFKWRGLFQDAVPGTGGLLEKESVTAYVGFDPTASSLHIGNLVPIMLLTHLQINGHNPIVLMGGATGRIGDPSGKTSERNLLDAATIEQNLAAQKVQFEKFIRFSGENAAVMVNNYDWFKNVNVLDFMREVGKHLTVSYMLAKDSVKTRLEGGLSFTEFSYQLIQGYDFYHLYKHYNCKLQMGGSDQWGNITTGTELIRRMGGGDVYALTAPLVTKADGSKFGKSEGGNIWLDAELTSPYKFYQYFFNSADNDAVNFLKLFSLKTTADIEAIIDEHENAEGARIAQRALAEELTSRIHSQEDLDMVLKANAILFGNSTSADLASLNERQLLEIFDGVPQGEIKKSQLAAGLGLIELLGTASGFLKSNGEARRAIKEGSIRVNKNSVTDEKLMITEKDLLSEKYILLQRGKKNYFLVKVF